MTDRKLLLGFALGFVLAWVGSATPVRAGYSELERINQSLNRIANALERKCQ